MSDGERIRWKGARWMEIMCSPCRRRTFTSGLGTTPPDWLPHQQRARNPAPATARRHHLRGLISQRFCARYGTPTVPSSSGISASDPHHHQIAMATVDNIHGEKRPSSEGSLPRLGRTQNGKEAAAYSLDERRRAALAEIDNAKFSCVFLLSVYSKSSF